MWTKEAEIPLLEQITLWDTLGKADLILFLVLGGRAYCLSHQ